VFFYFRRCDFEQQVVTGTQVSLHLMGFAAPDKVGEHLLWDKGNVAEGISQ
jgi:hypothetical protein